MAGTEKKVLAPCNECGGGHRNHTVLSETETKWQTDWACGVELHQVCQCLGCDSIRFRREAWDSDNVDRVTGDAVITVQVFPEPPTLKRPRIETHGLPPRISRIYGETATAFNAGLAVLTGGGLRAIVEAICIEQQVAGRNLQQRIDALANANILSQPQAELLHEERYLGNAALHEIDPPAEQDLKDGLEIVEGLLKTIYVLPQRAARLRAARTAEAPADEAPPEDNP